MQVAAPAAAPSGAPVFTVAARKASPEFSLLPGRMAAPDVAPARVGRTGSVPPVGAPDVTVPIPAAARFQASLGIGRGGSCAPLSLAPAMSAAREPLTSGRCTPVVRAVRSMAMAATTIGTSGDRLAGATAFRGFGRALTHTVTAVDAAAAAQRSPRGILGHLS